MTRARYLLTVLLVVMPLLAVDRGGWLGFAPVKWMAMSTIGFALVALSIAAGAVRRPPAVLAVVTVVWVGWLGVCSAVGRDPVAAWVGTAERNTGWVMWLLAALLMWCAAPRQALIDGLLIVGSVLAPVLVVEAAGAKLVDAGTDRLTGTFGSAAYLGAVSCLIAPVAAAAVTDRAAALWRRASGAVALFAAVLGIVGSGTRGAWVGGAAVAAYGAWRARRVVQKVMTATLIAVIAVVVAIAATPVVDRATSSLDRGVAGGASRLDEWRVGLHVFAAHPVVGAGPEGYRVVFADGVDPAYEAAHDRDPQSDRAHNGMLDIALIGGVSGLALWVAIVVVVVRRVRVASPLALGLGAYLVQQQFLFPLAEVEPIVWAAAGSLALESCAPLRLGASWRRALTLVASFTAAAAVWFGALDVSADRLASRAIHNGDALLASEAAERRPDRVRLHMLVAALQDDPDAALVAAERALDWSPGDPIALTRRAQYLTIVDPALAIAEIDRLLVDDPFNSQLHLFRGVAAANTNDLVGAENSWLRSIELNPRGVAARQNLLRLLLQQGRQADAEALVADTREVTGQEIGNE